MTRLLSCGWILGAGPGHGRLPRGNEQRWRPCPGLPRGCAAAYGRMPLARWVMQLLGAALSPDGTRVATADLEGYLRVLNAATGKPVLPGIRASALYAYSVAWSRDGSRLVTAASDGTVRLYDARTGEQIGTPLPVPGADLSPGP